METLSLICIAIAALIPQYYFVISLLQRASINRKLRNDLLSLAYLVIELGPGISSFSVVEFMIASSDETQVRLAFIFVVGLIITYLGRKLRDAIATKTTPRKNEVTRTWGSLSKKRVQEASND